jgi:hypothetical protein
MILLAICDAALMVYLSVGLWQRRARAIGVTTVVQSGEAVPEGNGGRVRKAVEEIPEVHRQLDWRLLALADLHRCVANLREVGCPEATIKDIILAEVNRRYAPRERALKMRYEDYELWESPSPGARNVLDSQMQLSALYAEKKALLRDLLGVEVELPMPKGLRDGAQSQLEMALATLPEGKRAQVRSIQEGYLAEMQRLKVNTLNFLEGPDVELLAKLKAERWRELAKTLTPDELVDFHLQTSSLGQMVRARAGSDVSEPEFREAYKKILAKYTDAAANESADSASLMASMSKLRGEALRGDVFKEVLGDQRWTEMQQARDPVYRQLKEAGAQMGLPAEVIEKAYAVQQAARQDFAQQFSNPNLSNEERQRMAKEYSDSMTKGMRDVFGEEGFRKFQETRRPAGLKPAPQAPPR